jgi:hypothetical protein
MPAGASRSAPKPTRGKPRPASRNRQSRKPRAPRLGLPLFFVILLVLLAAATVPLAALFFLLTRDPNRITPQGIVIHHSALATPNDDRRADAKVLDRIHARRGFGVEYEGRIYHIGYHYVIRHDGLVQPGRPERCIGAHCRGHNDYLGICVLGTFTDREPTRAQQRALIRLCRDLMARHNIPPERVLRHRDLGRTECPGERFPFSALRRRLRRSLRDGQSFLTDGT